MTGVEFHGALRDLRMTQRQFAAKSGSAISTVNRWVKGTQPIPGLVDWVIELLKARNDSE